MFHDFTPLLNPTFPYRSPSTIPDHNQKGQLVSQEVHLSVLKQPIQTLLQGLEDLFHFHHSRTQYICAT